MAINDLFSQKVKVINIGLTSFASDIQKTGTQVVQVDWKPPIAVSESSREAISKNRQIIEEANKKAIQKILSSKPFIVGLETAGEVIDGMKKKLILHAGPPVKWQDMSGPTKGAVMGALIYEGLATDEKSAQKLAASGEIDFAPCHQHSAVGPMAGVVSYSMPVWIIQNREFGNYAYATLNEGLGKVLRFGAYSDDVISRLKWMEKVLYPALKKAVKISGGIDLKNIIAQALHMGDEVHNRNRAATSLFYRAIAPLLVEAIEEKEILVEVLKFINGNDHFFLNLVMPAGKCSLDAARDVKNSSILACMARNGTEFGVQLLGQDKKVWFTGQAPIPDALFFAGFSKDDAAGDIGDSTITESFGLGGFAIAASPAIVQFVGGSATDALGYTKKMYEITEAENNVFQVPALNFRGTPTGIDVVKVVESGLTPFINTGVAHKKPGIGQVGAGILSAPEEPFQKAYECLADSFASN